ncbi:Receptor-like cytosolic serine/threonine-protein kinase RBK1 [Camellia lanceoleosa]|uniref:Receptor-like cytosolic serine/threonine-protein kinase RBK1 n=1 Tax=Camellia lanceoleosa TaxID=1840588 RepID=A0ACC0GS68_9ERIC|nr:Receptor-like cytosolic serine/threonine-protein kinase RBK1 [Camellia lanceoleosa]
MLKLSSSEALLPQLHSYGGAVLQHNVDGKRDHMLQKHRERPTWHLEGKILGKSDADPITARNEISDFGLAKWLPEKWLHHIVHPIEGTFGYMAPEYFMHGIVDEKTDIFAFGVLLLEIATGHHAVDSYRQSLVMRIIDFGSAVDEFTRKHLYGLYGPSSSEQTYYHTPSEALLNASRFQGSTSTALKYDLWSVGVVALEMIVGTPYVFQLSHQSYAVLILQSESLHEDEMNLLFRFRSFAALCNKMTRDLEHLRGRKERIAEDWLSVSDAHIFNLCPEDEHRKVINR